MTMRITYANQLANSLYALQDEVERMTEYSVLAQAILGTATQLSGFACTPSSIPDLVVHVAGGVIFSMADLLETALGDLPSQIPSNTNEVLKYAYQLTTTDFVITPPPSIGFSRNDIIQFTFQEVDGDSQSIPFWNGVSGNVPNPPVFQTKNVRRLTNVIISIKQGTAASTGTQTTPTPDTGYVAGWIINTTQGQTQITGANITLYPNAPFISNLTTAISQAFADARYAFKAQGVLAGSITAYAAASIPAGYLACDGTAVSRTTYATLFTAIGTTWGVGDGSTTFNVPFLSGRAPIGSGTGAGLTARTLGAIGGEETHQLTVPEMPSHFHNLNGVTGIADNNGGVAGTTDVGTQDSGVTQSTGGDGAHNNMQPFAVVNYIIKT